MMGCHIDSARPLGWRGYHHTVSPLFLVSCPGRFLPRYCPVIEIHVYIHACVHTFAHLHVRVSMSVCWLCTESGGLPFRRLCRGWWRRGLSLWQLTVPPVAAELSDWVPFVSRCTDAHDVDAFFCHTCVKCYLKFISFIESTISTNFDHFVVLYTIINKWQGTLPWNLDASILEVMPKSNVKQTML